MASLPGVEAEEGFIVLCTADGLKKIPLDSIDSASFDGDSASESNSLELVAMHGSQHCTLCNAGSLSSSDMAQAIIPVESFDFSALLVPVSFLRIDQPKPNTPYSPSPQQRAPPRSVI